MTKVQKPVASQVRAPAARKEVAKPAAQPPPAAAKGWVAQGAARVGKAVGLGLGVAVTEGLRLVPGWDKPVVNAAGKPVASVPGARREGDYAIRKRHEEVVGPQLHEKAEHMKPGLLHELVEGLAAGATKAPGATYHLDAQIDHALHPGKK